MLTKISGLTSQVRRRAALPCKASGAALSHKASGAALPCKTRNAVLALSIISLFNFNADCPAAAADKDKEVIPAAADAIGNFSPLLMPDDAAARGINLSGDTKITSISDGKYNLSCGCALISTDAPIYVETCRAKVFAQAGASIVIGAKKEATRILNLSDRKHDSVRVIFGDKHISLNPGEELSIVSKNASDADKAATEHVIRYRNAEKIAVDPEYTAVLFEFSLGDAMKHCLIFKQLSSSSDEKDKALLAEIIKTAAAVNTMFAKSREKYGHGDEDKTRVAGKKKQNKKLAARNSKSV